jgi:hypothetical protein
MVMVKKPDIIIEMGYKDDAGNTTNCLATAGPTITGSTGGSTLGPGKIVLVEWGHPLLPFSV